MKNIKFFRTVYLEHISSKLQKLDSSQNSMEVDEDGLFTDTVLAMRVEMAQSCQEQNNFSLALKILKETYSVCVFCLAIPKISLF